MENDEVSYDLVKCIIGGSSTETCQKSYLCTITNSKRYNYKECTWTNL